MNQEESKLQQDGGPMLVFENARVDTAGATDIGKVRQKNEDQYLIAGLRRVVEIEETSIPIEGRLGFSRGASALLLLVADGVGGSKGGKEASSRTLDTIVRYVAGSSLFFSNLDQDGQRALLHDLTLSVQWSHAAVRNQAAGRTSLHGMATTLTMALVLWPRAYVVQIGDSRCYHLRPPTITQVTKDQTMAQEMIDQGLLPAAAAEQSPLSNVLSQAVGNKESEIWPEISSLDLEAGDTLLLCTDGLTEHVAEAQIAEVATKAGSAKEACAWLIEAALKDGGSDNVTVVVTRLLPECCAPCGDAWPCWENVQRFRIAGKTLSNLRPRGVRKLSGRVSAVPWTLRGHFLRRATESRGLLGAALQPICEACQLHAPGRRHPLLARSVLLARKLPIVVGKMRLSRRPTEVAMFGATTGEDECISRAKLRPTTAGSAIARDGMPRRAADSVLVTGGCIRVTATP